MRLFKPSTWNTAVQKTVLTFLIFGGLASIVGAIGHTTLINDYLSRMTVTITGGRRIVTAIDNIAIGGTTPAAGAYTTLSATGAGTFAGANTLGAGTKHLGYVVSDAAETTSDNSAEATLTTFPLSASSTCFIVADVVGRAATGTTVISAQVTGTFERDAAISMIKTGTDTKNSDVSAGTVFGSGVYIRWVADTDGASNEVQLVVKGTDSRMQWVSTVRSLTVTTDGTE